MRKQFWILGLALCASSVAMAAAADKVSVKEPFVRLAPPNAPATGAFMVIRNSGDKAVKLVKADNPASRVTELHNHINEGGVMKMRPVPAIEIPANGEAVLKPGSLHVMLIDLKKPMNEGDNVPITLEFDDGSRIKVDAKVLRPAPMPMEHRH